MFPELRIKCCFFPDFQTLSTPIPDNISINTKTRVGHWLCDNNGGNPKYSEMNLSKFRFIDKIDPRLLE
jgi:hypothetical protein